VYADAPPEVRARVERLWLAVEFAESRGARASHIEEKATSRGHLSHVFAGRRRRLENETLEAYARETGVSPLWLVSNHGPMIATEDARGDRGSDFVRNMELWDHEGNCRAIYQEAGADPADPPGPHVLARMLGVTIRYDCVRLIGGAAFAVINRREFIFLRPGFPPLVEGVKVYHELAERHLRRARGELEHERACDELAYHLRMPREAFRWLLEDVGYDLAALAEPWPTTQTGAALRLLEVTDRPGVVVTPRDVRVRGPEWCWPAAAELRRIARSTPPPDGLRAVPITDRSCSVLLLAS